MVKRYSWEFEAYIHENLKHEIQFIVKSNESLADNKIKNEIEQLLWKSRHGYTIKKHETLTTIPAIHV